MQIFTVNITRVVWPCVTNLLDLRYFCEHSPLFYHLNLICGRYWSWKINIYFLVNIFVRYTFPMKFKDESTSEIPRDGLFPLFSWHLEKPFRNYYIQKTKMSKSINDSFASWSQSMVTIGSLIDKLHTDLASWSVL